MAHAGQGCALGTRIFVPDGREAELIEQIAKVFSRIRVGPADAADTQMGPVITAAQRARCEHFVALAIEHGRRVAAGGKRPAHPSRGYSFEPTLLDLPATRHPAAQDELFGPAVSVIGSRDLHHTRASATPSPY